MISQPLFIVIIDALVGMILLWSGIRGLVQNPSAIAEAFPRMGLREVIRGLFILPLVLTLLFVLATFALYPEADAEARITQALLLLGWWAAVVLFVFSIYVGLRSTAGVPASAVIGLLITLPPLILFTSIPRFVQVFSVDGYDRAVIIGLALVAMCYTILRRLGRAEPQE